MNTRAMDLLFLCPVGLSSHNVTAACAHLADKFGHDSCACAMDLCMCPIGLLSCNVSAGAALFTDKFGHVSDNCAIVTGETPIYTLAFHGQNHKSAR